MNCVFSQPVNIGTEEMPDFEFAEFTCYNLPADTNEQIINPEYPERNFYIQKSLSYGDVLIVWFLTFFLIAIISKSIFNFLWNK